MTMVTLDALLCEPGVREVLELRSRVGLVALHGGSLDRMTDVIAAAAAARSGASLYMVVQPEDLRWHLPSSLMGRGASDGLDRLLDHVDVILSLHGHGCDGLLLDTPWDPSHGHADWSRSASILLGGRDRGLATWLADRLRAALPSYRVVDDLDLVPPSLRGLHPANVANLARGGVQIEMPPSVRGLGPLGGGERRARAGLQPETAALVDALATAAVDLATIIVGAPPTWQGGFHGQPGADHRP
jgi:phage replication-related protein YjqB (UPF0714/DUF867 family)